MADEVQTIEGEVRRVLFKNEENGYAVVRLEQESGKTITAAGPLGTVFEDDSLKLKGAFKQHAKFGPQFQVASFHRLGPTTIKGIERYLSGPRVKGVGPELARRLVAAFGAKTLDILDREPERLLEVDGIGKKRAAQITEDWSQESDRRELLVFLQGHGLGPGIAARVDASIGTNALSKIQRNPFLVVEKVHGVGFRTADRMAQSMGHSQTSPLRLRAGILYLLEDALTSGSLCLPGEDLMEKASNLLGVDSQILRPVLKEMVQKEVIVIARPKADDSNPGNSSFKVYQQFAWMAEQEAAELLRERMPPPSMAGQFGPTTPSTHPDLDHLSEEQNEAVRTLENAPLSVLTGGPGVGKTTVMRSLVSLWLRTKKRVVLACPTGRAAKRLEEVSGIPASTLHRMLKFDGQKRKFAHNVDFPVAADVVVIDETSMMDLPLFVHLLRALKAKTQLILVGDPDQLPSVGPGQVLRDLVESKVVPVVKLTTVFRQAGGSAIVSLAHSILDGELFDIHTDGGNEVQWIETSDAEDGAKKIGELVTQVMPGRSDVNSHRDVQVLTPMHKGPVGTQELNRVVAAGIGEDRPALEFGDRIFRVGDRVMQIRNDYDRELFNGDLGWVTRIDGPTFKMDVEFDGRTIEFERNQLSSLQVAWAISVHKSQGGEYPAVVLALFNQHWMMLQRQILYTAITRAKSCLVIVGSRTALERAISNRETQHRFSHFRDWLKGQNAEIWRRAPESL
ncbi:MAG: exodeoxyribonuclease V alpha subunit [Planctomycetota bacterium]|jgi:exodeoxyribonuclease V alpha subunit